MEEFRFLPKGEIAVDNFQAMETLLGVLIDNKYVVMVSREEELYIINYIYSRYTDRNDVVFQSRDIVEDYLYNREENE